MKNKIVIKTQNKVDIFRKQALCKNKFQSMCD